MIREIDKVRSENTEVTKVNLFISFGCSKNNQGITTHYIRHMKRTLGLNYRLKTNGVLVNETTIVTMRKKMIMMMITAVNLNM